MAQTPASHVTIFSTYCVGQRSKRAAGSNFAQLHAFSDISYLFELVILGLIFFHHRFFPINELKLLAMASITTTIFDLPIELLLHIINYLDYPSSVALLHTNRSFRSIVPVQPPMTAEQKLSFLCAIELWPTQVLRSRTKSCYANQPIFQLLMIPDTSTSFPAIYA